MDSSKYGRLDSCPAPMPTPWPSNLKALEVGMANLARHVETTRATVTVARAGDEVVAEVSDGAGGVRARAVVPETASSARNGAETRPGGGSG